MLHYLLVMQLSLLSPDPDPSQWSCDVAIEELLSMHNSSASQYFSEIEDVMDYPWRQGLSWEDKRTIAGWVVSSREISNWFVEQKLKEDNGQALSLMPTEAKQLILEIRVEECSRSTAAGNRLLAGKAGTQMHFFQTVLNEKFRDIMYTILRGQL